MANYCERQLVCLILQAVLDLRCENAHTVMPTNHLLSTYIDSRTQLSTLLELASYYDQSSKLPLESVSLSIGFNSIIKEDDVSENKVQIVKEVLRNCGRQVLEIEKLIDEEFVNHYYLGCVQVQPSETKEITQWDNKSLFTVISPLYTLEVSLFGYSNTKEKVKQWLNSNQECKDKQCELIQKRETATSLHYSLSKILNQSDFSQNTHELPLIKSIKNDNLLASEDSSVHELIPSQDMYESLGEQSQTIQIIPRHSESIRLFESKEEQFHELTLCKDLQFYCENEELFKELTRIQQQHESQKKAREAEGRLTGTFESRLARKFKKLSDAFKK